MNQLLLEAPKNFKSLKEYKTFLRQFKNAGSVRTGYFYSFIYDYSLDYDFETLKYFDYFPKVLIFNCPDNIHCFGINFSHMPLLSRNWLLSRLKLINPKALDHKVPVKINVSYATLKALMKKVPGIVRNYRRDRMSEIKAIPNNKWHEIVQFQPPTYHAVTFEQVVEKYRTL